MGRWVFAIIAIVLVAGSVTEIMPLRLPNAASARKLDPVEFHEGQVFPTLVFPSLDGGRPASVADFRGKKLMLHIFASW